mmetsp:Transcript_23416/g.31923  ORF Transcript_23416/g.31923 Transcript_23416/m.31923 type:complete len:224 (-) Transcript_23416:838-1509(-)
MLPDSLEELRASSVTSTESARFLVKVPSVRSDSACTETPVPKELLRFSASPTWTRTRRECFSTRLIFSRKLITPTLSRCTNSSRTRKDIILLPRFARVVSFSMRFLPVANLTRRMLPFLSSRFSLALTTAIVPRLYTEILSPRTSFSSRTKSSTRSRSSILVPLSFTTLTRSWMRSLVLLTTSLLRFLERVTDPSATSGPSVLLSTSFSPVSLPLTVRMTKRS